MMRLIKIIITSLIAFTFPVSAFANAACEKHAKTRLDFIYCTEADTKKILSDAEKLYNALRKIVKGDNLVALDKNFQLWKDKLDSDCSLVEFAFNDWIIDNNYARDTGLISTQCQQDIAMDELQFYKWLTCPGETKASTNCQKIKKILNAPTAK
jgi:hypothetical protein